MVVASVPMVIDSLIDIVKFLVHSATVVTLFANPIATMLGALSIVLTYFGVKELWGEAEEKDTVKKFAIAKVLVAFAMFILAQIGLV